MTNDYHVSAAYLRLMLQGDERAAVLVSSRLGPELKVAANSNYVSGQLINRIYEIFASQGLDSWVTRYGTQLGVGSHGPLGFAVLSAPDLGTALETLTEFMVIRTSAFESQVRERQNRLEIVLVDRPHHPLAGRWIVESGFLVIQKLIETITLHPLGDNANLAFAYPELSSHKALEKLYNLPCNFDAAENILSIPASWARIPSPLSDPDGFLSNIAKCREMKLSLDQDKHDVMRLIHTRLQNHFDRRLSNQPHSGKIPSLTMIADELFMSPRTLIRKLERQGGSYKQVLEQVRLVRAEHLLKQTHFTAAEIAEKLGYQEPANFGRAFKRWTGRTPAAWRRNQ